MDLEDLEDGEYIPGLSTVTVPAWSNDRKLLSESQQMRLRDRLEEDILHISRRYLQRLADEASGYDSFAELLHDVDRFVDLLWYSITHTSSETAAFQMAYLLRIADELVDYIEGYNDASAAEPMLRLLAKLDEMLVQLADGQHPVRFTSTETVRLVSIVERTRVVVVEVLRTGFEREVSQVYEKVLEAAGQPTGIPQLEEFKSEELTEPAVSSPGDVESSS